MASERPYFDLYFLRMAHLAAQRSSCIRRQVGAVIVVDRAIVSTGYNGTPAGTTNCDKGGCDRCLSTAPSLGSYDSCLCVHAESNAILLAAKRGSAVAGGTLYVTLRPCFGCLKEVIQAGIVNVLYTGDAPYPDHGLERSYHRLLQESGVSMRQHPIDTTWLP